MKISIDTRTIKPGEIFIPVVGKNFDGHQFIPEAIKKGATVLDVDLIEYAKKYRKKLKCKIIGITGSAGKTTVKDMLYSVLSQRYNVIKTYENQNNEVGVPLTVLSADAQTDILIVEMAIRKPKDMSILTQVVRPTHTVITNIGVTHAENFLSINELIKEKAEIFKKALNWESKNRVSFLNASNPAYKKLVKKATQSDYKIIPFQGQDKLDENINLCYTVGKQFELTNNEIRKGLDQFKTSSHRLKKIELNNLTIIDDTYNSNPDGIQYALDYMQYLEGRKIVVLGDMLELGTFSKNEHKKAIEITIERGAEIVFTLGDRFYDYSQQHSQQYSQENDQVFCFRSREELHQLLIEELKPNDTVLVKGSRGMTMEKTVHYLVENYKK